MDIPPGIAARAASLAPRVAKVTRNDATLGTDGTTPIAGRICGGPR